MKKQTLKFILLGVLLAAAAVGIALGHEYIRLEKIQAAQRQFQAWYEARPLTFLGGYALLYFLMTLAAVPGGSIVTVLAGALFGLWLGTLVISVGGLLGATGTFLISRFLLWNWIEARLGKQLEPINRGIETEGAFYLFTLRLIHIVPFVMLNGAAGITRLKLSTFVWVTATAMLPGTMIFVNAGNQLSQIESIRDILSWQVLGSFALLGSLPLVTRIAVRAVRKRRGRKQNDAPTTPASSNRSRHRPSEERRDG